jgi:flagellar hook-associated protein 2
MSALQFPGLLSGIDTNTLISQLMALERRTLNIYQQRVSGWEDKKNALSELESKLSTLRSTVSALSNAEQLRAFNIASSDADILTAEATNSAFEGNHTIIVNQLATADRWVHAAGLEYAEDYVGAGTLIYSYNGKETVITTTDTTTLEDLAGLINNDADNPGVTASLLNYDDAYHLILNGNDAGSNYQVSVNSTTTEVLQAVDPLTVDNDNATLSTRITQLDQFGENLLTAGETIIIEGFDRNNNPISATLELTSTTKIGNLIDKIEDAFGGNVIATLENGKIVVTDKVAGDSQLFLSLAFSNGTRPDLPTVDTLTEGGTPGILLGFEPSDFTHTQTAQDSEIKVDGYPPDLEWISRSSNTIDDVLYGVTLHLHDVTDDMGEELTLTRDVQSVKEKLSAMVTAYNSAVAYIKQKTGYNDVLKTSGILMGDYVVSTIRNQLFTPLIAQTSGFVTDVDSFLMPGQIGLQLAGDGTLSLDSNAFDKAIAEDYMGVLAVIGAAKTGSSDSNTVRFYGASEAYTTAGTYNVEVTVSGGEITGARIKLAAESTWRDATFRGNVITGVSSFDSNGNPLNPENGLQLSVDLSQDSPPGEPFSATIRVKQGFAGAVEDALGKMLKSSTGSIDIDQKNIDDTIKNLQNRIADEQYRVTQKESRLVAKFARLERTLALMQNQLAALGLGSS